MKHRMKVGTAVQSTYNGQWHGVVISQGLVNEDCYYVMPILTAKGKVQRKPSAHFLNAHWLRPSSLESRVLEVARGELRNRILKTEGVEV